MTDYISLWLTVGAEKYTREICWELQANRYTKSLLIQILFVEKDVFLACALSVHPWHQYAEASNKEVHKFCTGLQFTVCRSTLTSISIDSY
jgi:hypothetical protein